MNNRWVNLRTIGPAVIFSAIFGLPLNQQVFAQGAVLEEIMVTARRREESLQSVPDAVTAFTSETLEDLGIRFLRGFPGPCTEPVVFATGAPIVRAIPDWRYGASATASRAGPRSPTWWTESPPIHWTASSAAHWSISRESRSCEDLRAHYTALERLQEQSML